MRRESCRDLFHVVYDLLVHSEDSCTAVMFLFQGKLFRSSKPRLKNVSLVLVSCGEILLVEFLRNLSFI